MLTALPRSPRRLPWPMPAICLATLLAVLAAAEEPAPLEERWRVIPGAETEIARLLAEVQTRETAIPAWEAFLTAHPAESLKLIVALSHDDAWKPAANLGFKLYLLREKPQDVVEAAQQLPAASRERLPYLFERLNLDGTNVAFALKTLLVLSHLGDYSRGYDWGHQAWLRWRTPALMTHVVRTVRRGNLDPQIWEVGGQRLLAQGNENYRAIETAFYAELAKGLRAGPVIRSMLDIAELANAEPEAMQFLCERLEPLGLHQEIDDLLRNAIDPALMYLRFRDGLKREPADDEWAKILQHADQPAECARLGRLLTRTHHPRAQAAWARLLECEKPDAILVADAYLNLGREAERRADFQASLDYYTKLQDHLKTSPIEELADYRDRLAKHLERLRGELADGQTDYQVKLQLAKVALDDEDFLLAGERLQEAIALDPERMDAHALLYSTCARAAWFSRLPPLGKKLSELKTDNPELFVSLAFSLADAQFLDQALDYANRAVAASPDNSSAFLARAAVYERLHRYDEALADIAEAGRANPRQPRILMARGLVHAKRGQLEPAIESLEQYAAIEADNYVSLWVFLLRHRLGKNDSAALTERLEYEIDDDETWVVRLYEYVLGRIDEAGLLAAAQATTPPDKARGCLCEAWFYIGQMALARGDIAYARTSFQQAIDQGVIVFMEHHWALAELERLARP